MTFEQRRALAAFLVREDFGYSGGFATVGSINIFAPQYGYVNYPLLYWLQATAPDLSTYQRQEWYGLYAQDQITLWNNLHVLIGGRYDWASNVAGNSFVQSPPEPGALPHQAINQQRFSPRVGLVFDVAPWLSFYGNYLQSLANNTIGLTFSGLPFPAGRAQSYEGGMKMSLFDNKVLATFAFYDLIKTNVVTPDLAHPGFSTAIGEAESKGAEFDIAGAVTDQLSLIASDAHTDAVATQDAFFTGNYLPNVPLNSGSIWAKYQIIPNQLAVGAGVYAAGTRHGDLANSFTLPGCTRVDAMASYKIDVAGHPLLAQLNIKNLFNTKWYKTVNQIDGVPRADILVGEPFTVIGSLNMTF